MTPPPFGYRDKFAHARPAEVETPELDVTPETPEDHLEPEHTDQTSTDQTSTGTPNAASSTAAGEDLEGTSPALEGAGPDALAAADPSAAGADVEAGHDSTGEEGTA